MTIRFSSTRIAKSILLVTLGSSFAFANKSSNLLILVHGFKGDSIETWKDPKTKFSWQGLVQSDAEFRDFKVYSFSYDTALLNPGMSTFAISEQLREKISQESNGIDNIYIVAHSFGGILTMEAVNGLYGFDQRVFGKVRGIFLVATPSRGTRFIEENRLELFPNIALGEMKSMDINSYLDALESKWRSILRWRNRGSKLYPLIYTSYETLKTPSFPRPRIIVDRQAMFPYDDDGAPYPAPQKNHITIVKPKDSKDDVFLWVKKRIRDIGEGYISSAISDIDRPFNESKYYSDTQSHLDKSLFASKRFSNVKIKTIDPSGGYSCFDYETFEAIKEDDNSIVFSNELEKPVVFLRFYYEKSTGNLKIYFDDLQYNRLSKRASNETRLDYLRFEKALMGNARIVFQDLATGRVLFRTGHSLPTNLERDELADKMIDVFQKLVRIEHKFGIQIALATRFDQKTLKKIDYVCAVLDGKSIPVESPAIFQLGNLKEKEEFIRNFYPGNFPNGMAYQYVRKSEPINILGQDIDLEDTTLFFPPSKMYPPLEKLRNDASEAPIEVRIESINPERKAVLKHSVYFRNDNIE